ncbi:hypothetical protein [Halorussus ruber]|uniref:hypothetical protein n=1 Tax=Halorussus ruber TaxID=1126238 RepID=UPI00109223FE|nr:hypothetical protein [Halorussus ruber]
MDPMGGREGTRTQLLRSIALLVAVVGMLTVGTLGPGAFTLESAVAAAAAVSTASQSASPAPLVAAGLFVGGVLLAVHAEFGLFGPVNPNSSGRWASCRICDHRIDAGRSECPYCRTSDPVEE